MKTNEGGDVKQTWTPTDADWKRYGARPMTREEIAAEKKAIDEARKSVKK